MFFLKKNNLRYFFNPPDATFFTTALLDKLLGAYGDIGEHTVISVQGKNIQKQQSNTTGFDGAERGGLRNCIARNFKPLLVF